MNADPRPHPAAIIVENLAPLVGVLFFGWSVAPVMVVYWVENGLRGLDTAARMLLASGGDGPAGLLGTDLAGRLRGPAPAHHVATGDGAGAPEGQGGRIPLAGRVVMTGFFLVHYGGFWAVHGVFVFALFVGSGPFGMVGFNRPRAAGLPTAEVALAAGLIAATLAVSLARDLLRPGGDRPGASALRLMVGAYGRVMVLHVAILLGGFALVLLGSPTPALVLLIALKTAAELMARRGPARLDDGGGIA